MDRIPRRDLETKRLKEARRANRDNAVPARSPARRNGGAHEVSAQTSALRRGIDGERSQEKNRRSRLDPPNAAHAKHGASLIQRHTRQRRHGDGPAFTDPLTRLGESAGPKRAIENRLNCGGVLGLLGGQGVGHGGAALRGARARRQRRYLQRRNARPYSSPSLASSSIPSLSIFANPSFARFWAARWFGTLAVQMQLTAMGWQVYDAARAEGRSVPEAAFVLGLVGLAQFLPLLVLSLFGGQAADRYDRKLILFACFAGKALVAGLLALFANAGAMLIIPIVFSAAIAAGAINAFMPPAASALMPMLVAREDLPQAIAWSSLSFNSGLIIGPALGGLLYGLGAHVPYFAAFALLAVGASMVIALRSPKHEPQQDVQAMAMIAEGLRYVWSNKIVLGAISLDLVVVLLAGAVALLPVFARDILHAGPQELGVLRAAMGAGAAIVALLLAARPLRTRVGLWMFGATIAFGLATIVFGLSTHLWLSVAALAVAGGVDMISVYVRQSLIQLATPDAMRGRVSAVSFVFISASNELGDFEAGLVARLVGPVAAVTLGGALAVAASLGWMRLFPDLRKADTLIPRA